jgi:hypothetical protein
MDAKETRGKKWTDVMAKATFENDSKTLDWMLTQPAIQSDIEAYNNSIKPQKIITKKEK